MEDIFWCYQGILRTGDLRESDDEQAIADICASILWGSPVEASGDFLNHLYSKECAEYGEVNKLLGSYGRAKLEYEVKTVFSTDTTRGEDPRTAPDWARQSRLEMQRVKVTLRRQYPVP